MSGPPRPDRDRLAPIVDSGPPGADGWPIGDGSRPRMDASRRALGPGVRSGGPVVRRYAATIVSWLCLVYLAASLGLWAFVSLVGDRWWLATVVLFGPRWVFLTPMAILIPAALLAHLRSLWLLLGAGITIIGPVMGFCVPWPSFTREPAARFSIRVLTCNAGGGHFRSGDLSELIVATRPDLVGLQEGYIRTLPANTWPDGWSLQTNVASRYPIRKVEKLDPGSLGGDGFVTRFDLETPGGLVHFFNLHLETVRDGLEAVMSRKWRGAPELTANIALRERESEAASRWVLPFIGLGDRETARPVLISGDFNLPTDSDIYQLYWAEYTNAFSSAGLGFGYTKFTRWFGIRIDHVLAGPGWRCRRCWVGPDVGSDHRPVLADLEWVGSAD